MRLEQLSLKIPGDEFLIRFHERLTVVSGIGVLERRALIDSLVGSLVGEAGETEISYTDAQGRRVTVACVGGAVTCTFDDGTPAATLGELLGRRSAGLRDLLVLTAADLGLHGAARAGEPAELAEARAALAATTDELHAAYSARQAVDAVREELAVLEEQIRLNEDNQARRRYARLLVDLERVRAEAAALRAGRNGANTDRHLLDAADRTHQLSSAWTQAAARLDAVLAEVGDRPRLDERTVEDMLAVPDHEPEDLDALVERLVSVEDEEDRLSSRLSEMAASHLPEPSTPLVADLARLDQQALWEANARVLATAEVVERESLALGGLDGSDREVDTVEELDRCHEEVVEAETQLERSKRKGIMSAGSGVAGAAVAAALAPIAAPVALAGAAGAAGWMLMRPKRRLAKAQAREQEALDNIGATTWLAFHMRRVEAMVDRDARERYELAVLEHRVATSAWNEVAGEIDPRLAAPLSDEVRAYAAALRDLGGAASEIENLRNDLVGRVQPAVAAAREALLDACQPYGVDDLTLAAELVRHNAKMGAQARAQRRLERAEAEEASHREQLDAALRDLGFAEGELSDRLGAFEWALSRAQERERARASARELPDVEAELVKLEEEARRTRRPEWAGVTPADAAAPDIDQIIARRDSAAAAYQAAVSLVPDLERLADRHSALERRVHALEGRLGDGAATEGDSPATRQYLLSQVTEYCQAGPDGEALPVLVDEALVRLGGDAKWELLDMVERLGEKTQIVYLTDDPYVAAWARRRAATGAITLLEPVAETV